MKIKLILGLLVLVLFIIGCSETPTGKEIQEETKIIESTATPKESLLNPVDKVIKTANIGEKVIVDDISYIVNDIKTYTYIGDNEYLRTKADGIFYVISLTIENL